MFSPGDLERIPKKIEDLFTALEMRIMEDVIRRIKTNQGISRTTDWRLYRLNQLGESKRVIKKLIQDTLNLSKKEVKHIYNDAIRQGYVRDESLYKQKGKPFVPYEDNEPLQQMIQSVQEQTNGTLKNITGTTGFAKKVNGKIEFTELSDFYQKELDKAITEVETGVFDYNSTLKRLVADMTNSGLRTVEYVSGRSIRIESAARMCLMTGITQVTGHVAAENMKKLETEYVEVSWHASARPSHQVWQGRVFRWKQTEGSAVGDKKESSQNRKPPKELKTIDYSDKELVKSELERYEKMIADEQVENAVVITKSGKVIQCFGDLNGVYPDEDLGDELRGSQVTHNHPIGSVNEYSFSKRDIALFIDCELDLLRGVDERYIYELTREGLEVNSPLLLDDLTEYDAQHERVIDIARNYRIGYRRWKR